MNNRAGFAFVAIVSLVSLLGNVPARSQGLLTDCAQEINSYCSNVTAGDGRIVACLIAYEDKISPQCRLTVYLGAGQLGKRTLALAKLYKICVPFVKAHCANVTPGGARIYKCLKKKRAYIDGECKASLPKFESMFLN